MLARLRLGPKLLLAPALLLMLLIASSGSAWWAMGRQQAMLETIVDVRAARIREASSLASDAQAAQARGYQLLTWISASMSAPRTAALVNDIHTRHAAIGATFTRLQALRPPAERDLLAQGARDWEQYVRAVEDVIDMSRGDQSLAASAMVKAERAFGQVAARLSELSQREQALAEAAARAAARDVQRMSVLMPILVALSVIIALAISLAVRRSLLAEVRSIAQVALDLAGGKLTVRARDYGGDEIAQTSRALDESIHNLNGTLKGIMDSASALGEASQANGAMVERLARVMAATEAEERMLDLPDALSVVDRRDINSHHSALVDEAASVAAALQGKASSLSQAVALFQLDDDKEGKPGKVRLRLAARRD